MNPVRELIQRIRVLDLGPLPAPRLAVNATVHQGLQMLVRGRRGAVVVIDGATPIGIFTERDVVYRLPDGLFSAHGTRRHSPLREVMSSSPVTIQRQATLREAIETMTEHSYRQLVVVDESSALRGLLTTGDLVQCLIDQFPEHTVNLPPRLRQQYHRPEGA